VGSGWPCSQPTAGQGSSSSPPLTHPHARVTSTPLCNGTRVCEEMPAIVRRGRVKGRAPTSTTTSQRSVSIGEADVSQVARVRLAPTSVSAGDHDPGSQSNEEGEVEEGDDGAGLMSSRAAAAQPPPKRLRGEASVAGVRGNVHDVVTVDDDDDDDGDGVGRSLFIHKERASACADDLDECLGTNTFSHAASKSAASAQQGNTGGSKSLVTNDDVTTPPTSASLLRAVKTAVSTSATSREAAEAVRRALIVVPERSRDVEAWAERALASTASVSSNFSSSSRQPSSSTEDTLALTAALDLVRRVAADVADEFALAEQEHLHDR
jgi:hypothetical protein